MDSLIKRKYELTRCINCKKEYKIVHIIYPTNMEGRHESFYVCPYCGHETVVHLLGNEDITFYK